MDEPTIREYAEELALRTCYTVAEAAEAISRVLQMFEQAMNTVAEMAEKILSMVQAVEELENLDFPPPRSLRTAWEREKRRAYEQRVRAEIKRHAGARLYRRIYKPP